MTKGDRKEQLTYALALLAVPGVGRGRFNRLVNCLDSPSAVLAASKKKLESIPGISATIAAAIKNKADIDSAGEIADRIVALGWDFLYKSDSDYPKRLSQIEEPPPILYRVGRATTDKEKMIAIVGTRHASDVGRRFTRQLASDLTDSGIVVVSGMAEGIDAAAHQGTLSRSGWTVAVWGRPLDIVYPECNKSLAAEIKQKGTIYSEYPPGTAYLKGSFPERNRIISGLCEGVVLVEAGKKSGALITANYALDQNRELFAAPGGPGDARATGCNSLIKSGAKLITCAQDIFDELPYLVNEIKSHQFSRIPDMTKSELRMIELLSSGPLQLDQMSFAAELSVPETMELLLALELKGVVQELSGKRFVLAG